MIFSGKKERKKDRKKERKTPEAMEKWKKWELHVHVYNVTCQQVNS